MLFKMAIENWTNYFSNIYQGIRLLFSEPKESVYVKASSHSEYQEFEAWRLGFIKYLITIENYILKDMRPQLLHKILLLSQKDIYRQIKSPFFYHEYLQILERNLSEKTAVVFTHILRDVRARLRQKLLRQPSLAVQYFRKDVVLQLIRWSGKKTTLDRSKQMLQYYKKLVPQDVYVPVVLELKKFFKNYGDADISKVDTENVLYLALQKQIDKIFAQSPLFKASEVRKTSHHKAKEKPKLAALAIWILIAGGNCYISSLRENKNSIYDLFNFNDVHVDPLLMHGMLQLFSWQYTQNQATEMQVGIYLMLGASLIRKSFACDYQHPSEYKMFKSEEPITFYNIYNWTTTEDIGYALSVQPVSDGGYVMLGVATSSYFSFLVKVNNTGEITWKKTMRLNFFFGHAVREIQDGTYIAVGETGFSEDRNVNIQNWDNNGTLIWSQQFDWDCESVAVAVQASKDGGFFVGGNLYDENGNSNSFISRWGGNKTLSWLKIVEMSVRNAIKFIQLGEDGNIIVLGDTYLDSNNANIFISIFDVDGNPIETRVIGAENKIGSTFVLPINNDLYITGRVFLESEDDSFLIKITNYTIQWAKKFDLDNKVITLQQDSNGGFISVGGFVSNNTNSFRPQILAWTQNGTISAARFSNVSAADDSNFNIIAKTFDGGFVLSGINTGKQGYNTMLVKLDSNAELINCPLFFEMPVPNIQSISFVLTVANITVQNRLVNLTTNSVSALTAALELVRKCPDDKGGKGDKNLWFIIGSAIGGGVIILSVIIFTVICLKHKRNRTNQNSTEDVKFIREFDFNKLKIGPSLGSGGYGEVFKGSAGVALPEVAIKKLQTGSEDRVAATKEEFMRELKLMRILDHPNIVGLYGFSVHHLQEYDEYYIIMEFVPNRSLAEALFEEISKNQYINITSLAWQQRFDIAVGIARGLALLHPNIIHADLKSYNILLDEHYRPKICDFGMANLLNKLGHSTISSGKSRSNEYYVAPELLDGTGQFPDEKTDMYSYGKILEDMVGAVFRDEMLGQVNNTNNQPNVLNMDNQQGHDYQRKMRELMNWCTMFHDRRPTAPDALDFLEGRIQEIPFKETDSLLENSPPV